MVKQDKDTLARMLRKLKKESPQQEGKRSTITECADFLLGVIGAKV